MNEKQNTKQGLQQSRAISWRVRAAIGLLMVLAIVTISITNRLLTDRFTESTRNRAELRIALYSGNLLAELRQNAIVPQLLARDPTLIGALNTANYSLSTQRLISFVDQRDYIYEAPLGLLLMVFLDLVFDITDYILHRHLSLHHQLRSKGPRRLREASSTGNCQSSAGNCPRWNGNFVYWNDE